MSTEDLKIKLAEVNSEIKALEEKRLLIEKALIESSETFEEKFRVWVGSSNKIDEPWMIRKNEYPLLYKFFSSWDMNRYQTYDVLDYLEDDIYFLTHPEDYAEDIKEHPERAYSEEHIAEFTALAKEIMEKNIGSFTCDW